ncbi:hypothetical protein BESB_053960 [Besnoitia besnoiti]|uniref:Digestive organ expansion factor-like protein n=1 Tax=Besnoitia besnoiti TaxID=94643 RepID=A0A2A9MCN2_BESBE|nr:hypothetical protein BESB_053960 [Besnoitia besnoiti]PFH35745.1 hypothetical protein BESB_053960 [Besnoitia besnoiti]
MGRASRFGGGNRRKSAGKAKKKGKKQGRKLDAEDLYYARLAEEAHVEEERKAKKKAEKAAKKKAKRGGEARGDEDLAEDFVFPQFEDRSGVEKKKGQGYFRQLNEDGRKKKTNSFSRLLNAFKSPALPRPGGKTNQTASAAANKKSDFESNHEETYEEEEGAEEGEGENEVANEEEGEENEQEEVEEEEEEGDEGEEAGEEEEEEGDEGEEAGEEEEEEGEEGEEAAEESDEGEEEGDGEEGEGEEGEDEEEAAQSIAETLARGDHAESSDEDEEFALDSVSPVATSSARLLGDAYYQAHYLPAPGQSLPFAPFDFFWTFEEAVASDASVMSRLSVQQRARVEEQKKNTPVELLHLQSSAFLMQQEAAKDRDASKCKQKECAAPSAAALLLGDEENEKEDEDDDDEEDVGGGAEGEQKGSGVVTREALVERQKSKRSRGRLGKLFVQPQGFAPYSAALPSNAAQAPASCADDAAVARGRGEKEGTSRAETRAAPLEHEAIAPRVSASSASSSLRAPSSYFEYVLSTAVPAAPFDAAVSSVYGLPSSLLTSLRRVLASPRFASHAGDLPVAFRSFKTRSLFHYLSSYLDISCAHQTDASSPSLRLLYSLHAVAHIWKARYRVSVHSNLIKRVANKSPEERRKILARLQEQQARMRKHGLESAQRGESESETERAEIGNENGNETAAGRGATAGEEAGAQPDGAVTPEQAEAVERQDATKEEAEALQPSEAAAAELPGNTGIGLGGEALLERKRMSSDGSEDAATAEDGKRRKLTSNAEQPAAAPGGETRTLGNEGPEDWLEDQVRDGGYTRPRILFLLPFRSAAKEVVDNIIALMPGIQQVLNRRRYEEEFGISREEEIEQDKNFATGNKPEDFVSLFRGNDNDRFRLGIRIAQKSIVLYSPFYASDILVASPLGLRMIVGVTGEEKREFDFLSSLELVVVDRADVISMQNWAFLKDCLAAINLPPVSYTSFDIRRLRPSLMAGVGASDRQTLVFSHGRDAKIQGLFKQFCSNRRGVLHLFDPSQAVYAASVLPCVACEDAEKKRAKKHKLKKLGGAVVRVSRSATSWENWLRCEEENEAQRVGECGLGGDKDDTSGWKEPRRAAAMLKSVVTRAGMTGAQQFFCKVSCSQFAKASGCILKHFTTRVLPSLQGEFNRALIVLPSYLDYCRLWRSLKDQNVEFVSCHEYTSNQNITRARQRFHRGEVPILVTTVRFLFYRRYRLQGADRILFLGPPSSPEVYIHLLLHSLPDQEGAKKQVASGIGVYGKTRDFVEEEAAQFSKSGAAMCFFTQYHCYAMERLLGVQKAFSVLQIPAGKVVAVK